MKRFLPLLLVVFTLVLPGFARAQGGAGRGSVALAVPGRGAGPLELTQRGEAFVGEFVVQNNGAEPLTVSRIAPRGDDDDVRSPPLLAARFVDASDKATDKPSEKELAGGLTSAVVPPHAARQVRVTWQPGKEPRQRQLFGQIVVTSTDDAAGEVAMGVRASLPTELGPLGDHVLGALLLLPLLGVLLLAIAHFSKRGDDARLRFVPLAVTFLELLLALWIFRELRGDVVRADGNDGFQFIERAVWIRPLGVELFLGVDGLSAPLVVVTAVCSFAAAIASAGATSRRPALDAAMLLLGAGSLGLFLSLDLVLFLASFAAVLGALYFALALAGGLAREHAALKLLVMGLLSLALLLFAVVTLHESSDPTFLVDGTSVARTFSIPDMMRVAFHAKHVLVFGVPLVKAVWVALFLAFGILLAVFPLHTWLVDALAEAPAPVGMLLATVVVHVGAYALLRIGFGILPEGARWAAGTLVSFGVVSVVYGALCALAQKDLRRMLAYATVSQMGMALVGIGSLTPQGIAGAVACLVGHGLSMGLLLLLLGAVEERARTRTVSELGGLTRDMPLLAALLGLGLLASLGAPGLAGFWGELLASMGAFPTYRGLGLVAALGGVLTAAYHLRALSALCLAPAREEWKKSPLLKDSGGRFPDLTPREMAAVVPLAVLVVLLGVWPAPLFGAMAGSVRDTTALVNPPGPDQIALR